MVQILRVSFLLPPVIGGSCLHINEVYVRFWSPPFLSSASSSSLWFLYILFVAYTTLGFVFDLLLSFNHLSHSKVHFPLLPCLLFFILLWVWVESIPGVLFSNPLLIAKLSQSVTLTWKRHVTKLLIASPSPLRGWWNRAMSVGVPLVFVGGVRPSTTPLDDEPVIVTTILPPFAFGAKGRRDNRDVRVSPCNRHSCSAGKLSSLPIIVGYEWVKNSVFMYHSLITSVVIVGALWH